VPYRFNRLCGAIIERCLQTFVPQSRDYGLPGDFARHDKSGRLRQFICCDLQRVAIRIAKIDRMRNFVILKFKFDSALFQFALCCEKIFTVGAKSEVKHPKFAVT
jgi:hypothetical protein